MRNISRHTTKSANYWTTNSRLIKDLFVTPSSRISNQAWPSSSVTKTAKLLRTLAGKLVMLRKRLNLPPVPIMAKMDNLPTPIIGATIIKT